MEKDMAEAAKWYKAAAEAGDPCGRGLCSHGPVQSWPIQSWPYVVVALYSYGLNG